MTDYLFYTVFTGNTIFLKKLWGYDCIQVHQESNSVEHFPMFLFFIRCDST